ncbi:MAG: C-GCAxxG-C-C family protein [Lachnospirales bacterium]
MKSRVKDAKIRFSEKGYNCCQAVACTYADLLGVDEKTVFKLAEGFGLGVAKRMETCGAVCGMVMVAGLKESDANLDNPKSKVTTMAVGNSLTREFEKLNSSCICGELKGVTTKGKILRSCRGCVADCARIIEDNLFKGQFEPYEERTEKE